MRPYIASLIFVAVWMTCCWLFHLDSQSYLLLGIPLVVFFQRIVVRRPLAQLWVRDAQTFRLDRIGIGIAVILAPLPALATATKHQTWQETSLFLCGLVGAIPAAFALRSQRLQPFRKALPAFAVAIVIGSTFFFAFAIRDARSPWFPWYKILPLAAQAWLMFTLGFVVEEVAFRGAIDSYVAPDNYPRDWKSAVFVSALWGLWHLPLDHISNLHSFAVALAEELCQHIAVGVPLSFCWRRSRTLVLPAAAHALIDAYRNIIA